MRSLPVVPGGHGARFRRHRGRIVCVPEGEAEEGVSPAVVTKLLGSSEDDLPTPTILLTNRAFSTVAVETLRDRLLNAGVRVVLGPGFESALYGRCVEAGVLPAILDEDVLERLVARVSANPGTEVTVDLETQSIEVPGTGAISFGLDPRSRRKLLLGLTELDEVLPHMERSSALRAADRQRRPWLYSGGA